MWRPSNIHQDMSELDLKNIEFLKDNGIREGLHLEYKLKFNKKLKSTICAFMNSDGGYLILGVEEEDEKIKEIIGIDNSFIEEFRKTFTQFDPFVDWDFELNLKEIPYTNNLFLYIIRIPVRDHSIMLDGVYYVRIGAQTMKLIKDSDIQDLKKRKGELDTFGREITRFKKIPNKDYSKFIGREKVYKEVINELKSHHFIISIDGIGGVGKSTLALEIAYNVYKQKNFDSVLWFSAKREKFIFSQITYIDPEFDNLDNLLERIAYEIKIENYDKFIKDNKIKIILKFLKENSTLLVLDNLETIEISEDFINFLAKINGKSKVLITSRKRLGQIERIINLNPFNFDNTKEFVKEEIRARSYLFPKPQKGSIKTIHNTVDGIPLAIKVLVGWVSSGLPLKQLKHKLKSSKEGILEFCFQETYNNHLTEEAKLLFCIFSILPDDIIDDDIKACVDLEPEILDASINELINFSLITRNPKSHLDDTSDTYKLLPLTRLFAYKKSQNYENLERRILKKYNRYIQEKSQFKIDLEVLKPERKLAGLNESQKKAYLKALKASETFDSGDYANALKLFTEADKISNDVPEVYYKWGTIEMKMGHLRKTDEIFDKAISLEPENPSYWLTWASFHKQLKNFTKAKEILLEAIEHVPKKNSYVLNRELGIVLSYNEEYNLSLEVLKTNLIQNPSKENHFILNTKTMISILLTWYFQSQHLRKAKHYEIAKKKLIGAIEFYTKNQNLVYKEDIGLILRIKIINLGLARLFSYSEFNKAQEYFKDAYFEHPSTPREKKHNTHYFQKDWRNFVDYWKPRGKAAKYYFTQK